MSASLTAEQIKSARRPNKIVNFEPFGGDVRIQKFSAARRIEITNKYGDADFQKDISGLLAMHADVLADSLIGDDHKALFTVEEAAEVCRDKDFETINQLVEHCLEFNGISRTAVEAEKKS